jgi:hypothetical protein
MVSTGGEEDGGEVLWSRVLITSRGWTASVEHVPAARPAMVSTSAGERRAWLSFMKERFSLSYCEA